MKVMLFLFVALVALFMILATIYMSLPSKVLGDLEKKLQGDDEEKTKESETT